MDWLDCPLIEQAGEGVGSAVDQGVRVRPQDLLNNLGLSEDELAGEDHVRMRW